MRKRLAAIVLLMLAVWALPVMAQAARRVSEHGRAVGVKTLIENHGFFANGCDRVERMLSAVNSDNYGLLLDTGNIVCVDEDAAVAARTSGGRDRPKNRRMRAPPFL